MALVQENNTATRIPHPMVPHLYRIRRMRNETHDTFTVELEPTDGTGKFSFAPGQFNMIYIYGVGEVPISISGDPQSTKTLMHTTREVGKVTKAMRNLKCRDTLGIRGPFGSHWPIEEARGSDIVIVTGGIGLAPLRPALYQILSQRDKYGKVVLLYGSRTPTDILFKRELHKWRSQFDLEIYVVVDRAMSGWRGNVGVVTTLIPKAPFDPMSAIALVCGPEVMMRYTVQELLKRGISAKKIYLSMERNMKCAIGFCGHCQYGPNFVCREGPIFCYTQIKDIFEKREI